MFTNTLHVLRIIRVTYEPGQNGQHRVVIIIKEVKYDYYLIYIKHCLETYCSVHVLYVHKVHVLVSCLILHAT